MRIFYLFISFSLFFVSCNSSKSTVQSTVIEPHIQKNENTSTYWQQHVDYTMDIDMDVNNYQYKGEQKLIYTNNSPDVLHKVFYHLYFNAFQPNSEMDARLQSIKDPDRRMVVNIGTKENPINESRISTLKPDEIGFIKVHSLTQNGSPLTYHTEGTILEVSLNQPIQPGEKVTFDMDFTAQVPVQIRRSGRNNKEGVALSMAQWYPKMAAYDFEGWHATPYIAREIHSVWGDFDVTIHIDRNYMIGGTGYLQNPQEIGFGYEDPTKPLNVPDTEKLSWHFKAPDVHDFTWAADPDFVHDTIEFCDGKILRFLYQDNPKTKENWKKLQPVAAKTMEFFSEYIGEYPYTQYSVIQGGDGGMEYGMCTLITANRTFESLVGVTMHEMAHAWFQFELATNESKHAWMDEGFTVFVETLAADKIMKNQGDFVFDGIYNTYFHMVNTGEEEPLTIHADRYVTNKSHVINAYYKGSVFISQLAYIIGWDTLTETLREYYIQWGGKHPSPNDFIRVAEKVSGLELDWYLNEFTQTTRTVDYEIKAIAGKKITLARIGLIPMPIDLEVTYTDGTKESFYIPLNLMRGEKQTNVSLLPDWSWGHPTYSFEATKEVQEVQIDPSQLLADINKKNNYLKIGDQ